MDGLDPRDGALGARPTPRLPHNINNRVASWMSDYATRVRTVTGLAPEPNPEVRITSRRGMATALADVSASMLPALPGGPKNGAGDWLMRQAAKQMARAMSKDVLGLYVPTWQAGGGPDALYIVAENIEEAAHELGLKPEALAHYVTFHEATHQWQFTAHPWLGDHMAKSAEALQNIASNVNPRDMLIRLVQSGGDITAAIPGVSEIQSTMSLVEGYADFMTEELGISRDPDLAAVATALASRRADKVNNPSRSPAQDLIGRLGGMDAKRRQYAEGKIFCEQVVKAGGHALLNQVWTSPQTLPTPAEMADPALWVRRMAGASGSGSGKAA